MHLRLILANKNERTATKMRKQQCIKNYGHRTYYKQKTPNFKNPSKTTIKYLTSLTTVNSHTIILAFYLVDKYFVLLTHLATHIIILH